MAGENEDDDDTIIIEADDDGTEKGKTPPAGKEPPPVVREPDAEDDDDAEDGDGGDGDEDSRLQVDADREALRARRRAAKKAKRERERVELHELRQFKTAAEERFRRLEGRAARVDTNELERRIASAQAAKDKALKDVAAALDAGDGAAHATAINALTEADYELRNLKAFKQRLAQPPQGDEARRAPPDPNAARAAFVEKVAPRAEAWAKRNPWYNHDGRDVASRLARAIDNELMNEGYDPTSAEYYAELDARLDEQAPDRAGATRPNGNGNGTPANGNKRRGPGLPMGGDRNNGGAGNAFTFSPARKQALIDMGVWDDPKERQKWAKVYRDHDRAAGGQRKSA